MAACLGNSIQHPNIKALNIHGALRRHGANKWIIFPWVNTVRDEAPSKSEEENAVFGGEAFGKLPTIFEATENDEGNKKRNHLQVITADPHKSDTFLCSFYQ